MWVNGVLAFLLIADLISFVSIFFLILGLLAILWVKVPFAPTPKAKIKEIIDWFNVQPGQKFYDLGCGDGRFIIEAAKRGAHAIGFEISPWAFLKAKLNIILAKSPATLIFKNFYQVPVTDADAVFCFLIDKVMPKVENKLMAELKSGTKVISYGFALPTWPPQQVLSSDPTRPTASKIYIYTK